MERKRGLSSMQKICIAAIWILLCVIFFIVSDKSMGENIFFAIASGVVIIIGINAGQNKFQKTNRRNRRR